MEDRCRLLAVNTSNADHQAIRALSWHPEFYRKQLPTKREMEVMRAHRALAPSRSSGMTNKTIARGLIVLAVLLSVVAGGFWFATAPAKAHFQPGGNCHIERVSANGTITFRLTNRTNHWVNIYCGLRFNSGALGYYTADMQPRWQITRRWNYGGARFGDWTTVWIVHVHVRGL